jgi:hypothetical protein
VDRVIVYVDENPLDTDFLNAQKNVMIALGMALQAIVGTATLVDGLVCAPTTPASLEVNVSSGSIMSLENVDGTAYGSLAADTTHQIVKQGIILNTTTLSCPVPSTTGYSINYLIEAAYEDVDTGSTVLPYYDASNPAVAYSGPNNTGISQNTVRQGQCVIAVKAGVAATTGTQTTPTPDAGYTGLWVVTVANGATTITSGNITEYAGAPLIANKLTALAPLASPALTGVPTVPTASPGTNTTQAASTAFVQAAVGGGGSGRTLLTGNKTFYISTTGNDSTGNGTSGNPWLTRQHAWNTVQNTYDLGGFTVTFQLADGTYTDSFAANASMVGQFSPGQVIFNGDSGTPTNVLINCSAGSPFGGVDSSYQIQNLKFQNSGGNGVFAETNANIAIGPGVTAGACSGSKIRAAYGGEVLINNSYTDVGNAQQHYEADDDGEIIVTGGITITESGTPAYSVAYAVATELGNILFQNTPTAVATFSGAATGVEYIASNNGVIQTQGSGGSYLPGSTSGSTSNGGVYA